MNLINIIIYVAVTQLFLILILLFFFQFTSTYLSYVSERRQRRLKRTETILLTCLNDNVELDQRAIKFFERRIFQFVETFRPMIKQYHHHPNWKNLHAQISKVILKPQAVFLSKSKNWFKRYLATQCLEYAAGQYDGQILMDLVQDPIMFVSVNSAMLICEQPIPPTVNKMIEAFSNKKQVIQSTFIRILVTKSVKQFKQVVILVDIINTRLAIDTHIPIRIFCYRILNALTHKVPIAAFVLEDIHTDNYELKIEVLTLLTALNPSQAKPFLEQALDDAHEELRASAIQLLASTKDESAIPLLMEKLSDPAWWVRIKAGNALLSYGQAGLLVLEEMTRSKDKFAAETAQSVLTILGHRKHL